MKLLLIKLILFFTIIFNLTIGLSAKELNAFYNIEIGTINIGSLKWSISLDDDNYKTSMFLEDRGLLSGLYKFSGEYLSEGMIFENEFIPFRYKQAWKTKKKTREVEILFDKKKVSVLNLSPKESELPRIEYLKIQGLVDPLSSFLNILTSGANNYKTIDGRRLYKMSLDLKKEKNMVSKKIYITDYFNIWADHKRKDLKFIITKQDKLEKDNFFPNNIKIKNKGFVFTLTKI